MINYERSYALSEDGASNEFLLQRLVAHVSEPKLLGMEMTWLFENDAAGSGIILILNKIRIFTLKKLKSSNKWMMILHQN